jgi:phospho-N-acetylmuramoyl-pentapeptide-transferase
LAALGLAGILGLIDDILNVWKIGPYGGGIHSGQRLVIYTVVGLVGGWWYVPFFVLVMIATSFSVNQTDGLDGLAGGTLASAFGAYAIIALMQGKEDLATLCATIVGALIAFLWFNIYPARFIMGDTGAMSLGVTLAVVAMLTNAGLLMPIIGVVFLVETITTIMQVLSKKIRGKKIFLIAPIHHHFEAKGWPEPKVVMRFWVISWIGAALGLAIALLESSMT